MKKILCTLGCLLQPLFGINIPQEICPRVDCGFDFGIDFLYLYSMVEELVVENLSKTETIEGYTISEVRRSSFIDFGWVPSFRVQASVLACDWAICGIYTRVCDQRDFFFQSTDAFPGEVSNTYIRHLRDNLDFANIDDHIEFNQGEILAIKELGCCPCPFDIYFGLQGFKIRFESLYSGQEPNNDPVFTKVDFCSDSWAIGFEVGSHFAFCLCKGLDFYADGSTSLVYTSMDESKQEIRSNGNFRDETFIEPVVGIRPCFHINLGLSYQCHCMPLIGHVGYEYFYFHHVLRQREERSYSMHGPSIGLVIGF